MALAALPGGTQGNQSADNALTMCLAGRSENRLGERGIRSFPPLSVKLCVRIFSRSINGVLVMDAAA